MSAPVPRGRSWSLRVRLVIALLVVATAGLAAVGASSVVILRHSLVNRVDAQLADLNRQWRGAVPRLRELNPGEAGPRALPTDFRVFLVRQDGTPLVVVGQAPGDSTGPELPALERPAVARQGGVPFTVADRVGDGEWRVRVEPVRGARSVVVAQSLANVDATVARLLWIEVVVGAAVLVLLGVVAAAVVRIGLRPLTRIEQTAAAIAAGDLDLRVAGDDQRTETGRLARALNTMLTRLGAAFQQREESEHRLRRFVADASHELRTPLTSIRGFAELYRRGGAPRRSDVDQMMARIEGEATRMGLLVDDLILLARLDRERPLDLSEVDLGDLARDAAQDARAHDPERQVHLAVGPAPVRVLGDERRLRQVVTNLVTNAVQHTPAAGPIRIQVGTGRSDDVRAPTAGAAGVTLPPGVAVAVVEVADTGPGVLPDQAPYVFDRLYRGDPARSRAHGGSGLGLAIAAAILTAHGGRLELVAAAPGAGARFRMLLPVDPADPVDPAGPGDPSGAVRSRVRDGRAVIMKTPGRSGVPQSS